MAQSAKLFPIRQEKRHEIISQVLGKYGMGSKPIKSSRQLFWEQKIMNEGFTIKILSEMEKEMPEKMIANITCCGNLTAFRLFKESLKNKKLADKLLSSHKHPLFVDEDDAKAFHSKDHQPVLSTNYTKVGTIQDQVTSIYELCIDKMNKDEIAPIYPTSLFIAEVYEKKGIILTKPLAEKLVSQVNEKILEFEKFLLNNGNHIDTVKKKAIEGITSFSMKKNLDYEMSNMLGERAIKLSDKLAPELGKQIAKAITKEDDGNAMISMEGMLKVLCNIYETPIEEFIPFISNRVFPKNPKK